MKNTGVENRHIPKIKFKDEFSYFYTKFVKTKIIMFNRYKHDYKLVCTTRNDNIHKFKRFVILS